MFTQRPSQTGEFFRSRSGVALLVFLAIAGFFLVAEHTAHLLGVLPYALLLLCPLMHLFMHRGRGGHRNHGGDAGNGDQRPEGGPR